AFGLTTASPECVACDFALRFISILLLTKAEGLGCAVDQFPKRDRPKTSPLSSSQQPMDHVFLRGHSPPKSGRPLPSAARIEHNSFYPAGGCVPRRFFWSSMIVSARSNRCFSRSFSRRESASSAASGFGSAVLGPRLAGLSASKAPAAR